MMNLRYELGKVMGNLLKINTHYPLVLAEDEKASKMGYPRFEFQILEVNSNQETMSIDSTYDSENEVIEDNYNRIARYMLDFTLIYKANEKINIDPLIKYLTNYYKLDRYFIAYDFSEGNFRDITINRDFKQTNKNMFYSDQSISRDGYSFTFDVEIIDKDIIPAGLKMKRGEFIE